MLSSSILSWKDAKGTDSGKIPNLLGRKFPVRISTQKLLSYLKFALYSSASTGKFQDSNRQQNTQLTEMLVHSMLLK
jgi:hypothetical protein